MRAQGWKSRIAGLLLCVPALVWIVPARLVHGASAQPTAPARLERFDADTDNPARRWSPIDPARLGDDPVVLLVHGLDEPGSIWDALAPELAAHDLTPIRFEYPNDQAIALSADLLDEAMASLRRRGVDRLWIVAHSMGGLVTLDALTRHEFDRTRWPEVRRVVTLGTPMGGSLLAPVRAIAELREHAMRAFKEGRLDESVLNRMAIDGSGEAGRDLRPGSDFLTDLHSRPRPEGPAITAIVAEMPKPDAEDVTRALLSNIPGPVATDPDARRAARDFGSWASRWLGEAVDLVGDGVVDADSGRSAWTTDVVPVRALHRSMITRVPCPVRGSAEPPAIAVVLDRIEQDLESSK